MRVLVVTCILTITVVLVTASLGQVPQKINYQGRLTDLETGEPITGEHDMTFRIFDVESGGTALWFEDRNVTADTSGVVSVILGSTNPIDITFEGSLWLEVEVGGEVLEPRRELVSVPYSLKAATSESAGNADSLGGLAASSFIQDGHSLDAVDGDPLDAVYVDQHGRVGIGTASPGADLHVYGDANEQVELWIENPNGGNSAVQMVTFSDGVAQAGISAYNAAAPQYANELVLYNDRSEGDIRFSTSSYGFMLLDHDGRVGIKTNDPSKELDVNGDIRADDLYLGDETQDGVLVVNRADNGFPVVEMRDTDDNGGGIMLREDGGQVHTSLEPDIDEGGGGWMEVRSSTGVQGITLDGNFNGTEKPRLTISSSLATVSFMTDHTGDASVNLPVDAIASDEIFDEPGVASDIAYHTSGGLTLSNGFNTLASRSIYAPASGFVLVIGSSQPTFTHSNGTDDQAEFGVSEASGSFPSNQDCLLMVPAAAATGVYTFPVTVHRLFAVPSAGDYTFYFLAKKYSGIITGNDVQLTMVYFPSNYGTVETLAGGGSGGALDVESDGIVVSREEQLSPEAETAESVYRARIEEELEAMRAEIAELRRELEADPNRRNQ